jgi:phosphohistidine phosphatase
VKRIYVLRHGKSDWNADYGVDHDRPLKPRGERAARLMGRFLAAAGERPDLVVASSAVRALNTAKLAAEAGRWNSDLRVEPALYSASRARVLQEIQALEAPVKSVLLAGHEPTCSDFVGSLIGSAEIRFPTAALACIDVSVEGWEDVELGLGALVWLVIPKLLASAGFDDD